MRIGLRTSNEQAIILGSQHISFGQNLPARIAESTGTVFYVGGAGASDANPGTSGSPWATSQKAVDTLTSGQTALFRTGTYTGVKIYHKTNAQTITLEADAGASPVFQGPAAGAVRVVDYWDSQNWRIRNIDLDGTGGALHIVGAVGTTTDTNGFCRNFEIYGCLLHDASAINQGTTGLVGFYADGNAVTGIQMYNCRSYRNSRRTVTTGIINSGATTIPVNGVLDCAASGSMWMPDHTLAAYTGTSGGNTLTGVTGVTTTWPSGTIMFMKGNLSPYQLDHGGYIHSTANLNSPDVLAANCIFHDNVGWGWQNYPTPDHTWTVNCVFAYNFNGGGMNYAQDSANQTTGNYTVNCIAYRNDDGAQITSHPSGYDITFVSSGCSPINHIDSCVGYQNGNAATGRNFGADNSGVVHSNKIEADPLFVAPGTTAANRNFHLQVGSPATSAGISAYTPSFDFDGASRTNADIGPYKV